MNKADKRVSRDGNRTTWVIIICPCNLTTVSVIPLTSPSRSVTLTNGSPLLVSHSAPKCYAGLSQSAFIPVLRGVTGNVIKAIQRKTAGVSGVVARRTPRYGQCQRRALDREDFETGKIETQITTEVRASARMSINTSAPRSTSLAHVGVSISPKRDDICLNICRHEQHCNKNK